MMPPNTVLSAAEGRQYTSREIFIIINAEKFDGRQNCEKKGSIPETLTFLAKINH